MADRLPACRLQARQAGGPPALTAGTAVFRRTQTFYTVSERLWKKCVHSTSQFLDSWLPNSMLRTFYTVSETTRVGSQPAQVGKMPARLGKRPTQLGSGPSRTGKRTTPVVHWPTPLGKLPTPLGKLPAPPGPTALDHPRPAGYTDPMPPLKSRLPVGLIRC